MNCCTPILINFLNVASSIIPFTPAMVALYGPDPAVDVYIKVGTEYQLSDFNSVQFDGSNILVDYGGMQSGFLKIS